MNKVISALSILGAAAIVFAFGYFAGRGAKGVVISKMETTTDTLWREIHDTCFVERDVAVVRTDTVRLAVANVPENAKTGTFRPSNVPENGNSWTHQDGYGYENGISWTDVVCAENAPTTHDTLYVRDSVLVEVPIEEKTFTGDNYSIVAEGYRVRLREVTVISPTVYVTETRYRTKRWSFNVGAQVGYGFTLRGASPYIGLGVGFGYTF